MADMFLIEDFREVIRSHLSGQGRKSRGASARLAEVIGIHTTTLSQILSGTKPLSLEHASLIADHFSFTELETDYFLALVQLSRAGNPSLIKKLNSQIKKLRLQARDLSKTLEGSSGLNFEAQAQFYSDWRYSAIRVLSSIDEYNSLESIAARLSLSRSEAKKITDFLVRTGLCEYSGTRLVPGPNYTHLPANSPLISKFHSNIRVKAMEHHARLSEDDLCYSSLFSIGKKDLDKVGAILIAAIKEINQIRDSSDPQTLRLIGIDWIEI